MKSPFDHIVGNDHIKKHLATMLSKGAIGQALLFAGPEGIGKTLFAQALGESLISATHTPHPDIHHYYPEGKLGMHSIDTVRQLTEEVYLPPTSSTHKVFILHDADRMLPTSSNALLKTFEEPAPFSVMILLSSTPLAIIPTILSRCRIVHFHPVGSDEIACYLEKNHQSSPEQSQSISRLACGSIGQAVRILKEGHQTRFDPLWRLLAQGPATSYIEILKVVETIDTDITAATTTENSPEEWNSLIEANALTAVQKQVLEKQMEGDIAIRAHEETELLLNGILAWYRDLHLLSVKGNPDYLFHPGYRDAMQHFLQRYTPVPLETALSAVDTSRLALARSTPFANVLETLLLKLL